jgi:hypothetical protein
LEIDEDIISITDYKKANDSFFGLIKEISNQVSGKRNNYKSDWTVKVYSGSIGTGVSARQSNNYADNISKAIISGLRSLSNGVRPVFFTDKALEHSKILASIFKESNNHSVRIWSKKEGYVYLDRNIATVVDDILTSFYTEDGSVEGFLEKVDGHNALSFVIYDVISDYSVKCEINENLLEQALKSFKKRIEVIGNVKYRKDGMPIGIVASRIINFPDKSEIPSIVQMRELLSTGNAQ